jgi:hypothetical protein
MNAPATSNRLPTLAAEIRDAHAAVQRGALAVAERAVAAGHALAEAKKLLPHGQWAGWLAAHAGFSERTARRYMAVARSGMKTAIVAEMGLAAAAEAATVKAFPLPVGTQTLRVRAGDDLAFVWPSASHEGHYHLAVYHSYHADEGWPGAMTTMRRPVAGGAVPGVLRLSRVRLTGADMLLTDLIDHAALAEMHEAADNVARCWREEAQARDDLVAALATPDPEGVPVLVEVRTLAAAMLTEAGELASRRTLAAEGERSR